MKNFNVVSKTSSDVTYIEGDIKKISLAEIDNKIKRAEEIIDVSEDTEVLAVKEAEDSLAALVAEIDTKVADRELNFQTKIESDLTTAKSNLDNTIKDAYKIYNDTVSNLKKESEEFAKSVCEYKENGLNSANENLNRAREALDKLRYAKVEAREELETLKSLKELILAERRKLETSINSTTIPSNLNSQAQVIYATQNKLKF